MQKRTIVQTIYRHANRFLRHPMVLALVTTSLASYMLPMILKQSEDRQVAHQIRTDLIKEISESAGKMVVAIQVSAHPTAQDQESYNRSYLEWEVQRAALENQIAARIKETAVRERWKRLSNAITQIYVLSGVTTYEDRREIVVGLKTVFELSATDWKTIESYDRKAGREAYQDFYGAWCRLHDAAVGEISIFTAMLLESSVALTGK